MLEYKSVIGVNPIDWQANEGNKCQVTLEPKSLIVRGCINRLKHVGLVIRALIY
jgi:hypothetical protein